MAGQEDPQAVRVREGPRVFLEELVGLLEMEGLVEGVEQVQLLEVRVVEALLGLQVVELLREARQRLLSGPVSWQNQPLRGHSPRS
jgi:hypothetical protein